jgi:hypothetical protein
MVAGLKAAKVILHHSFGSELPRALSNNFKI